MSEGVSITKARPILDSEKFEHISDSSVSRTPARVNPEKLKPVTVFDDFGAPVLACVASLGARGVPIHVYGSGIGAAARWSRYCSRFKHCPSVEDASIFLPWLSRKLRSGEIERVLPTTDLLAFYVSLLRDEFPVEVRRAIPTLAEIEKCLIKTRFAQACVRLDQAVPTTGSAEDLHSALALARQIGYPVIVKPNSHLGIGMAERGCVVECEAELRARFKLYPILAAHSIFADGYPELRTPLVQRFLPAGDHRVYSVTGIKDADAGILAASLSYKAEQWPPRVGISVVQVSCDNQRILRAGVAAVDRLISCGIFELEMVEQGEDLYIIELNPRGFGFMALDIALGNDLPWLWYQTTHGPVSIAAKSTQRSLQSRL
jgi:predicted ATP-grasp superfamily ATP-dependent carboligase